MREDAQSPGIENKQACNRLLNPFRYVMKFFGKSKFHKVMSEVVNMDQLPSDPKELKQGKIHYVLVHVRDEETKDIPDLIGKITDALIAHEGTIATICSSILVCTFGFPFQFGVGDRPTCNRAASDVLKIEPTRIRVLYGAAEGLYGNIGGDRRLAFSPVIPHFGERLLDLLGLEFGVAKWVEP
jgi:hypothetical protein